MIDTDNQSSNKLMWSFNEFFRMEAAGGVALMVCTLVAILWANSPWSEIYHALWQTKLTIGVADFVLSKAAILWINDGLMAIFFFLVGLEIKRELLVGGLSTPRQTIMPVVAAVGGMLLPALLFLWLSVDEASRAGWGIPMATDIAFALGILALLGNRVPVGLKVFLTAVAIVDDIGAILVIAIFYTTSLNLTALGIGVAVIGLMALLNLRFGVRYTTPYLVLGTIAWFAFLKSGVHATIAGVLAALTIPASTCLDGSGFIESLQQAAESFKKAHSPGKTVLSNKEQQEVLHTIESVYEKATTPLQNIEHALHPWVAFGIMPIFALANAGVTFKASIFQNLFSPLPLGIFMGLVVGKQVGVLGACWLVKVLGLASFPEKTTVMHMWGASCLAGVGFTMSIFIGNLALAGQEELVELSVVAVLIASISAGILGYLLLRNTAFSDAA